MLARVADRENMNGLGGFVDFEHDPVREPMAQHAAVMLVDPRVLRGGTLRKFHRLIRFFEEAPGRLRIDFLIPRLAPVEVVSNLGMDSQIVIIRDPRSPAA